MSENELAHALPATEQAEHTEPTEARQRRPRRRHNEPEPIGGTIQEIVENVAQQPVVQPSEQGAGEAHQPSFVERARARLGVPEKEERVKLPDPHFFESISLTDEKSGPKIHLGRSNTGRRRGSAGDMIIAFDKKPEGEVGELVLQALRDHGYNFTGKSWVKEMDSTARWRSQAEAERLFTDIGNTMREANGLPPTLGTEMGR